jgi:prepilin-type N-terminal cleavage/methylation domain-containing protein
MIKEEGRVLLLRFMKYHRTKNLNLKQVLVQRGLTLIEILVTVVIAAVILAFAVPNYTGYRDNINFNTSVQTVKSQLRSAQVCAISNPKVHCGVYFDTSSLENSLLVFQDTYKPADNKYEKQMDKIYLAPSVFDKKIKIQLSLDGSAKEIIFRGNGSAKIGGNITIKSPTKSAVINVLASTGRIKQN